MAGTTGLEPAASAVTGQRSNQLNYVPTRQINEMRDRQCLCGFCSNCLAELLTNRPQILVCALSDVQRSLRGPFPTIQVVTTLDPTTDEI